jgi:hypothetical protein
MPEAVRLARCLEPTIAGKQHLIHYSRVAGPAPLLMSELARPTPIRGVTKPSGYAAHSVGVGAPSTPLSQARRQQAALSPLGSGRAGFLRSTLSDLQAAGDLLCALPSPCPHTLLTEPLTFLVALPLRAFLGDATAFSRPTRTGSRSDIRACAQIERASLDTRKRWFLSHILPAYRTERHHGG